MNLQTFLKEMFNETNPRLPLIEEHEEADKPTQQNTVRHCTWLSLLLSLESAGCLPWSLGGPMAPLAAWA